MFGNGGYKKVAHLAKVNNPDPAYGCAKMFAAEWRCSGKSGTNTNSVPASAMETNVLTLNCQ